MRRPVWPASECHPCACHTCLNGLFREGSRPDLELHHFRPCTLAAFLVPGRVHRVARPEPATLPAGIRVVDPSRSDRKSTRLNSSHGYISYAVFCLKKKNRGARGHEFLKT